MLILKINFSKQTNPKEPSQTSACVLITHLTHPVGLLETKVKGIKFPLKEGGKKKRKREREIVMKQDNNRKKPKSTDAVDRDTGTERPGSLLASLCSFYSCSWIV